MQEDNLLRKCATIISKVDGKLEIMDSITFKTIQAEIDKKLLEQAEINDAVTYTESEGSAKILEIRKR